MGGSAGFKTGVADAEEAAGRACGEENVDKECVAVHVGFEAGAKNLTDGEAAVEQCGGAAVGGLPIQRVDVGKEEARADPGRRL